MKNIEFVKPDIKKRVIGLYFMRQVVMHLIKFVLWMLENNKSYLSAYFTTDEQGHQKLREMIEVKICQMWEIDCLLFSGVKLPNFPEDESDFTNSPCKKALG